MRNSVEILDFFCHPDFKTKNDIIELKMSILPQLTFMDILPKKIMRVKIPTFQHHSVEISGFSYNSDFT